MLKSLRLVRLVRLVRVMKISKLIEHISDIFEINSKYIYVLDLVILQVCYFFAYRTQAFESDICID